MSSVAEINLRSRSDLVCQPAASKSIASWVLKDPWSLEFFQLGEEEFFLFQLLRGPCTREMILESFDKAFAPKRLRPQRLQAFLVQLHRAGLLIAPTGGQGEVLREREQRRQSQERWRRFSNPLAIRFPGMNPSRFFEWLYPGVAWWFTVPAQMLCLLLLIAGVVNAWLLRDALVVEAARLDYWLEFKQMWLVLVAIGAVKVAHEFGHALTLRHWGGRCHELGIMLLAFSPCLYCNVSDAWLLDDKWRRIAVSFAGIWVELIVAATSVWIWSWTDTGILHDLAFVLSVVCSVNVLLINGNPLMRFDGYFVFSDWVERSNLAQQAGEALAQVIRRLWAPVRRVQPEGEQLPAWLASYALASFVYRVVVIAVLVWGLHQVLVPYRLEVLAWLALLMIVGQHAWSKAGWLRTHAETIALEGPGRWWKGRGGRFLALAG
ncbi:MAG: site-2 protease family protein, partial [Planctomycetota bacterium]|nr:site-2 protease family protein [Planctomycetota bacterium]